MRAERIDHGIKSSSIYQYPKRDRYKGDDPNRHQSRSHFCSARAIPLVHMIYASRDSRAGRYRFIFTPSPRASLSHSLLFRRDRRRSLLIPPISVPLLLLLPPLLPPSLLPLLASSLAHLSVPKLGPRSLSAILDSSPRAIETERIERAGRPAPRPTGIVSNFVMMRDACVSGGRQRYMREGSDGADCEKRGRMELANDGGRVGSSRI